MVRTFGNKGKEIPFPLVVATYNGGPCRLCLSERSCFLLSYCAKQGCGRKQNKKVTGSFEMAPHLTLLSHLHVFINVNVFWACLEIRAPPGIC